MYHDVHVEPVGAETDHALGFGSQIGEVGGEHRGRDFRRRHRNPSGRDDGVKERNSDEGREIRKPEKGNGGSWFVVQDGVFPPNSISHSTFPSSTMVKFPETQH